MARCVSEAAREREALKFATVFFHLVESTKFSSRETGLTSDDSGLTAFAQLGASRLAAAHCIISIFDQKNQYIIAEATPASSLARNVHQPEELWLGCTAVPRANSVCDLVLTTDAHETADDVAKPSSPVLPVSVIPDLTQDTRYLDKVHTSRPQQKRFYAGVPLRTSRGIDIGAFSIYDDQPREGLTASQLDFMRLMSRVVMEHLELRKSAESSGRSERMVRGIGSFVEGKSTMSNLWRGTNVAAFEQSGGEGRLNNNQQRLQKVENDKDANMDERADMQSRSLSNRIHKDKGDYFHAQMPPPMAERDPKGENSSPSEPSPSPSSSDGKTNAPADLDTLSTTDKATASTKFTLHSNASATSTAAKSFADESHSSDLREAFGKASNIIRESIEVEGVAFLDAVADTFGGLVPNDSGSDSTSSDSHPDTSGGEGGTDKDESEPNYCRILGFSTSEASSIDGKSIGSSQMKIPQKFLRALLRRYPAGKTFSFDSDGEMVSGDSEEDRVHVSDPSAEPGAERKRKVKQSRQSESAFLAATLKGARSIAMVPLWDSVREKWHAGAFVWTQNPDRILTLESEISYLRAFGSTIMAEVNRIETVHAERMKSDLLGSLSHELRSPLHGVLAGIDLVQDTELNTFQVDTLHSMESCGRTLLDVIEHLLDFSKLNRFVQTSKSQRRARSHGERPKDQQLSFESKMTPLTADVDLSILIEETVESVYAGLNYDRTRKPNQLETPGTRYEQGFFLSQDDQNSTSAQNGGVSVYLDMDANISWKRHVQPGGLRRILMNIFGNSMKYTKSGHVVVKMRQVKVPLKRNHQQTTLRLTVTDSGKGIAADFLRDKIFTPFSQEDTLQPGTGLGLSLIHQIITLLKGSISVESQLGRGTSIEVNVPLAPVQANPNFEQTGNLGPDATILKGLRVGLIGFKKVPDNLGLPHKPAPIERELLATTCRSWLQLEVVDEDSDEMRPDCIICTDAGMNGLSRSATGGLPPVVVVCPNGSVAQSLLQQKRLEGGNDFFEFITQPIGPHKLAKALLLAMERWTEFTTSQERALDPIPELRPQRSVVDLTHNPKVQDPQENADASISAPALLPTPEPHYAATEPPTRELDVRGEIQPTTEATETQVTTNDPSTYSTGEPAGDKVPKGFLIVDDNKINLQLLSAFMKKMKQPYKSASDGLEALQTYSATPGYFRCILMDISMPVMDGLEATRRIREFEHTQQLPRSLIVALTGMASAKVQQEAFGSGVDFFLPKPVRLKQLTELMQEKGVDLT